MESTNQHEAVPATVPLHVRQESEAILASGGSVEEAKKQFGLSEDQVNSILLMWVAVKFRRYSKADEKRALYLTGVTDPEDKRSDMERMLDKVWSIYPHAAEYLNRGKRIFELRELWALSDLELNLILFVYRTATGCGKEGKERYELTAVEREWDSLHSVISADTCKDGYWKPGH